MEVMAYTELSESTVMKTTIRHDGKTGEPTIDYLPMPKDLAEASKERYSRMPEHSVFVAKTPEEVEKVMGMAFSIENMGRKPGEGNPHMAKPPQGHYITERIYNNSQGEPEYVAVSTMVHDNGSFVHMESFGKDRDALYAHLNEREQVGRFNVYAEHLNGRDDPGYRIPPVTAGEICDHACVHAHAEKMYQGKQFNGPTNMKAPTFMRPDEIKDTYRETVAVTRGSKTMQDILRKDEPALEVSHEQEQGRA